MAILTVDVSAYHGDSKNRFRTQKNITLTGTHEGGGVISVATSETSWTVPTDIGNAGYLYIVNRDTTNFVDVGTATGVYPWRMPAEGPALIPLAPTTATLYFLADTAACDVEIHVWEA